jgi:sulfate adenylyltransferase subunit 1
LRSRFDEQTLSSVDEPESLSLNDIGRVVVRSAEPLPIDDYADSRRTGAFLVIDPADGGTLAGGLVGAPLAQLDKPEISEADPAAQDLVSPGP